MLIPLSRVPVVATKKFNPDFCNQSQTISDIASKIGVSLSQNEVNELVQAIAAGGQAGMAVALSIADSISAANYQITPQLLTNLTNTLSQGSNQSLQVSRLLQAKLRTITFRRR